MEGLKMTMFEELAKEMNVKIETDKNGLYVGMWWYDVSLREYSF